MGRNEQVNLLIGQSSPSQQATGGTAPKVPGTLPPDGDQMVRRLAHVVLCVGIGHSVRQRFHVGSRDVRHPMRRALNGRGLAATGKGRGAASQNGHRSRQHAKRRQSWGGRGVLGCQVSHESLRCCFESQTRYAAPHTNPVARATTLRWENRGCTSVRPKKTTDSQVHAGP